MRRFVLTLVCLSSASFVFADEPVQLPRPVPATRPEVKRLLEDLKQRALRIPLPELTDKDKEALGERGGSYESRLRYHYMPASEGSAFGGGNRGRNGNGPGGGNAPAAGGNAAGGNNGPRRDFSRNADENMSLTYQFKTQLFWIVARTNNCQYCLGHQEWKLSATGMTDDAIAALDADWSVYNEAEQAAFKYARIITWEPHKLSDKVIEDVLKHYTPNQVLEMTMSMCGNNAINRWKEGAGIPQSSGNTFARRGEGGANTATTEHSDTFETPTSDKYQKLTSIVIPFEIADGKPTGRGISSRPGLEPRTAVLERLAGLKDRKPRLPLVESDVAAAWLKESNQELPVSNWVRLLATFPNDGRGRLNSLGAREKQTGDLTALQKAQVNWITARQDGAWYATAQALKTLKELGQTEDQIFALDGNWSEFSPGDRSLFQFAKHLAASPIAATDEDAAEALKQTSPRHLVQLINHVTACAYFNRLTEAAGLPSE
jgi:alkylhydroperoxidase family enzyme